MSQQLAFILRCQTAYCCSWAPVDAGNTVLVIGHNLDVIKMADRIIDMGPEGGDGGGTVVVSGTRKVAATPEGHTGKFIKKFLTAITHV